MTKEEYIEQMSALDVTFWLALKHNNLQAAEEIKKDIGNLLASARDELSSEDMMEVALILNANSIRNRI